MAKAKKSKRSKKRSATKSTRSRSRSTKGKSGSRSKPKDFPDDGPSKPNPRPKRAGRNSLHLGFDVSTQGIKATAIKAAYDKQAAEKRGPAEAIMAALAKAQTQLNSFQGEIKKTDDYFEAKAKVSMREGFNKAFVTHKTIDFDTEPTEAEATDAIEKDYPHLKVERIDWIRDMSYNRRIRTLQG